MFCKTTLQSIPWTESGVVNAETKRNVGRINQARINYLGEGRSVIVNPWDVVVAGL